MESEQTNETAEKPAKQLSEAEEKRYAEISQQVQNEFQVGEDFIRSWREKKRLFLKLYINQRKRQKRQDPLLGDPSRPGLRDHQEASLSRGN